MNHARAVSLTLATLGLLASIAKADVIVDTLGAANNGPGFGFNQTELHGFRFTTDSKGYLLTSIIGGLSIPSGGAVTSPELLLFSNSASNLPATLLDTLSTTPAAAPPGTLTNSYATTFTFISVGGVTLQPNTSYWGAYRTTTSTTMPSMSMYSGVVPPSNGGPGTIYDGIAVSSNGISWGNAFSGLGHYHRFQVNGAVIPEPGTFALLALGSFCTLTLRRRKHFARTGE
jgi:hypothetical protein